MKALAFELHLPSAHKAAVMLGIHAIEKYITLWVPRNANRKGQCVQMLRRKCRTVARKFSTGCFRFVQGGLDILKIC